jgi:ribosomal protein S18 acetylase RimI-like enzyme
LIAEISFLSQCLAYHYLGDVKRACSEAIFLESMLDESSEGEIWVAMDEGRPKGLLRLKSLPWDSVILCHPAFKISHLETFNASFIESEAILAALLDVCLGHLKQFPSAHCHTRIPSSAVDIKKSLAMAGFSKKDNLNTYGARLSEIKMFVDKYKASSLEIRPIRSDDVNWARQLSKNAVNPNDRFHADMLLSGHADDFMEGWIDGCLSGYCDNNFMASVDGQSAGFALWQSGKEESDSLGVQIAQLALGAVSKNFSGLGIHKALVAHGCEHFAGHGADFVVMPTQAENFAAIRSMNVLGWVLLKQESTWSIGFGF